MEKRPIEERVFARISGKSRTEQSHLKGANINTIVSRFAKTGLLPGRGSPGFYGDFTNVVDYQDALDRIMVAEERFMQLPAAIRKRFDNDPAKVIDFLADEKNRQEAIDIGLIEAPVSPVNVVPPVDPVGGENPPAGN